MTADRWGHRVACADEASVAAWDRAWASFLHFTGDPIGELDTATADDDAFVLGPVFRATYRVLGGSRLDAPALVDDLALVDARVGAADERGRAFAHALDALVAGDFTEAGRRWSAVAADTGDFCALRMAHDVHLHAGDADGRLAATAAAVDSWGDTDGAGFVWGMHSFALEELGRLDEAEEWGRAALDADPLDAWARHALAHVYETADDSAAAFALLDGGDPAGVAGADAVPVWHGQELLAVHIWWHLALRRLAVGDVDAVFAIVDRLMPVATTAFRMSDVTSLLVRLELAGVEVGERWHDVADRWDRLDEIHTCGFLDVHAAMAFARMPDHPGANRFFGGLTVAHAEGDHENDDTFRSVVRPLAEAIRLHARGQEADAAHLFDTTLPAAHRIGGSVAQRDILGLIRDAAVRR